MFIAHREFRLGRAPGSFGLNCEADGVSLAGVQLLRWTDAGLEPRLVGEIDVLAKAAYGVGVDALALSRGLRAAAQAHQQQQDRMLDVPGIAPLLSKLRKFMQSRSVRQLGWRAACS